jgi:hypothetical protein
MFPPTVQETQNICIHCQKCRYFYDLEYSGVFGVSKRNLRDTGTESFKNRVLIWPTISALPGGTDRNNKSLQESPFSQTTYEIKYHNMYSENCRSIPPFRRNMLSPALRPFRPWSNSLRNSDLHLAKLHGVTHHKTINLKTGYIPRSKEGSRWNKNKTKK